MFSKIKITFLSLFSILFVATPVVNADEPFCIADYSDISNGYHVGVMCDYFNLELDQFAIIGEVIDLYYDLDPFKFQDAIQDAFEEGVYLKNGTKLNVVQIRAIIDEILVVDGDGCNS